MLFALMCTDKPNSMALRMEVRPRHLDYIRELGGAVKIAGPFLSEDGQAMTGTLIIVEAADAESARGIADNDPYAKAGLFSHVDIRPWRWVVGAPKD